MAEIKASVDGISAKLSEYSTTEEMNSALEQNENAFAALANQVVMRTV